MTLEHIVDIYGSSIEVSFGVELPTIYDKINQKMSRGMI